jgi:SAM-dependent methyltransferase
MAIELDNANQEETSCICGATDITNHRILARDEISSEIFQYVTCNACGTERLSPRPVVSTIGRYYPTDYYAHTTPESTRGARSSPLERFLYFIFFAPKNERPFWVRKLHWLFYLLFFPIRYRTRLCFYPTKLRRVFEFGAARGDDLYTFRDIGWDVSGCEPSKKACEIARSRGIPLHCSTAEDVNLKNDYYSCVLINNVFEHLHNPLLILEKSHSALVDNGVLLLILPNHDSLAAKLFGAAWPGYDAPRHLWGFSPTSLTRALKATGFKIETIQHQAPTTWCWHAALAGQRLPTPVSRLRQIASSRFAYLMLPVGIVFSLLKKGDFIRVVARKNSAAT